MAYRIERAFYGDEKVSKDVTNSLRDKIFGTTIDVDVNEKIIPVFEVSGKVEITPLEEKKIRDDASRACGGVDQACIDRTEARARQDLLVNKQQKEEADEALIKGKRLTVVMIGPDGKRVRKVIPDGNKFKYDNVTSSDPKKPGGSLPSMSQFQSQLQVLGMLALAALVYVFSVAATYTLFMPLGVVIAAPVTAIAIFIPYSGYVIMFLYFMFSSAINTYIGKI